MTVSNEITDEFIEVLISSPKQPQGTPSPIVTKNRKHQRIAGFADNEGNRFTVYLRQSQRLVSDYSCGVWWERVGAARLCLVRYNGPAHWHPNKLEGVDILYKPHQHILTARYVSTTGVNPDGFAVERTDYHDLDGATRLMCAEAMLTTDPGELLSGISPILV